MKSWLLLLFFPFLLALSLFSLNKMEILLPPVPLSPGSSFYFAACPGKIL